MAHRNKNKEQDMESLLVQPIPNTIPTGMYLKLVRVQSGLAQFQVAAALGHSNGWLCDIENGRTPLTLDMAEQIINACGQA